MEFAEGEFDKDVARAFDKDALFPQAIWEKAGWLGFIGKHLPKKFGGGGMGHLENVLVAEAFARNDSTTRTSSIVPYELDTFSEFIPS